MKRWILAAFALVGVAGTRLVVHALDALPREERALAVALEDDAIDARGAEVADTTSGCTAGMAAKLFMSVFLTSSSTRAVQALATAGIVSS